MGGGESKACGAKWRCFQLQIFKKKYFPRNFNWNLKWNVKWNLEWNLKWNLK